MFHESVCRVARGWVDVGSFHKRLVVRFMILQRQSGIYWIQPRMTASKREEVERLTRRGRDFLENDSWKRKLLHNSHILGGLYRDSNSNSVA
jgi:hypothetical protein